MERGSGLTRRQHLMNFPDGHSMYIGHPCFIFAFTRRGDQVEVTYEVRDRQAPPSPERIAWAHSLLDMKITDDLPDDPEWAALRYAVFAPPITWEGKAKLDALLNSNNR